MQTRFLHTSDWQLGVTRRFLGPDAQARWAQARFDGVRELGRLAAEAGCRFVVVAGDVFESNQVDRRTVSRACDALAAIPVPVYLLPGNHDPLDAASVYACRAWRERKPVHVHVLDTAGAVWEPCPGVEVTGAPWLSRRPLDDLVAGAASRLSPVTDRLRVMVGHGAVDRLSPDRDHPALIRVETAEQAIREGLYHYLALGDRHSFTQVGSSGRIVYSGTQEAYDFDEVDPGHAVVVDLSREGATVTPHRIGRWRFLVREAAVTTDAEVAALERQLAAIGDKESTVLKLGLVGTPCLRTYARLEEVEAHAGDLFAAVVRSVSRSDLMVRPDGDDLGSLGLAGFAAAAVERLQVQAMAPGPERETAADALALLIRLAGRGEA